MIIPANFVFGALAGAAATYVMKDESAREKFLDATDKAKSALGLSKKDDADSLENDTDAAEAIVKEDKA